MNLTPPPEMKAALGGYGARQSKPTAGVHDGVRAKALVLTKGDRRFVLVTADVLAFPPGFKTAVAERLASAGWTPEQLMLLPSHSHTSIDMMALHSGNVFGNPRLGIYQKELREYTADTLARVVRDASKSLAPVLAGSATIAVSDKNRNRRDGTGVHDTNLTITRLDTTDRRPLAILVNWTAHPTFMDEDDMLFSGDWPGHLQRTVEALIGGSVTALFYNGAEGDQSPVPPPDCCSNWERAERYGRDMGIVAWHAWERIQPAEVSLFAYHSQTITLPKRQWHPDFMNTGGREYGLDEEKMQGLIEQLMPTETHSTCLRLGNLVIVGVPGEIAAQLGLDLKKNVQGATGATCVTIGGLADEWTSYILPADEYRKGGYEASASFYGETLGATLVEGAASGAQALHAVERE